MPSDSTVSSHQEHFFITQLSIQQSGVVNICKIQLILLCLIVRCLCCVVYTIVHTLTIGPAQLMGCLNIANMHVNYHCLHFKAYITVFIFLFNSGQNVVEGNKQNLILLHQMICF